MSPNFAHALNAYHNEGNKNVLFNLGLYFKSGNEGTPKSPKLALLCLAEGGKNGHEGAMTHFCIAMGKFNLDGLDLSDKQKEEFKGLNAKFSQKLDEIEAKEEREMSKYMQEYEKRQPSKETSTGGQERF